MQLTPLLGLLAMDDHLSLKGSRRFVDFSPYAFKFPELQRARCGAQQLLGDCGPQRFRKIEFHSGIPVPYCRQMVVEDRPGSSVAVRGRLWSFAVVCDRQSTRAKVSTSTRATPLRFNNLAQAETVAPVV